MGLLLAVVVHSANIQDRDGARYLLTYIAEWLPRLERVVADGGYRGKLVSWVAATFGWTLETVLRMADMVGYEVLPKRWVVERTFSWTDQNRRMSKDYERLTETSEAFIYVAMSRLMVRRLARF